MVKNRSAKTLRHGRLKRSTVKTLLLTALSVLLFATPGSVLLARDPHSAFYSTDNDRIFWFIHISDPHMGTSGSQDSDNLAWIVNEARDVINPAFIVNSGDLTDSTDGDNPMPYGGPYIEEWEEYYGILDAAGIDSDFYYDIPGNHDHYNDKDFVYYLNNSIQGLATGGTQISWRRDFAFGKYHFLGVCTAGNDGAAFSLLPPNYGDNAGLDTDELAYIQNKLETNTDAVLTIIFGHHPILPTGDSTETSLTYGAEDFIDLMEEFGVSMYAFGHTHRYKEGFLTGDTSDGIFYLNVAALGKSDEKHYNVTAIDCNGISTVAMNVETWPVVLITAPVDRNLGTDDSPYAYSIDDLNPKPIRALVFDANPVTQVRFRVDATGDWQPMTQVSGNPYLWEAFLDDASPLSEEDHTLEVQSTGSSTRSDIIVIGGHTSNGSSGESGGGGCFINTAWH
ncbi:MAG: metallophosphoesterase [Syntrophobacterales bacterium]|nr:metallophosphoesterase [Syntrophobacterales bacterium]